MARFEEVESERSPTVAHLTAPGCVCVSSFRSTCFRTGEHSHSRSKLTRPFITAMLSTMAVTDSFLSCSLFHSSVLNKFVKNGLNLG